MQQEPRGHHGDRLLLHRQPAPPPGRGRTRPGHFPSPPTPASTAPGAPQGSWLPAHRPHDLARRLDRAGDRPGPGLRRRPTALPNYTPGRGGDRRALRAPKPQHAGRPGRVGVYHLRPGRLPPAPAVLAQLGRLDGPRGRHATRTTSTTTPPPGPTSSTSTTPCTWPQGDSLGNPTFPAETGHCTDTSATAPASPRRRPRPACWRRSAHIMLTHVLANNPRVQYDTPDRPDRQPRLKNTILDPHQQHAVPSTTAASTPPPRSSS